ncbi:MAG: cation transporting ATPase C-terminal domain-containing protein [Culicoidibacterales bacterium]
MVYVPFLQTVFQTTALAISDWLFLCIWPILIFGIEELRKAVMRLRN